VTAQRRDLELDDVEAKEEIPRGLAGGEVHVLDDQVGRLAAEGGEGLVRAAGTDRIDAVEVERASEASGV